MKHLLLIALGGAFGALGRYWLSTAVNAYSQNKWQLVGFPLGTLVVNIIGSFLIGILYVLILERLSLHPDWRSVAVVGFLGAFTTFSSFSLETITLLENGQLGNAVLYVASSLVLCLLVTWLAITLTRLT
ncbi:MAG: CrcB protein [Oceanicoccus sp.]|jgi:CrcB protein